VLGQCNVLLLNCSVHCSSSDLQERVHWGKDIWGSEFWAVAALSARTFAKIGQITLVPASRDLVCERVPGFRMHLPRQTSCCVTYCKGVSSSLVSPDFMYTNVCKQM